MKSEEGTPDRGMEELLVPWRPLDGKQPWRPASLPSPLETAIANRTDRAGRLTLRSDSNMLWGHVSAWLLLAVAAGTNNRSGLRGPDALTVGESVFIAACLFGASVAALIVLGRAHVVVADGLLIVRNPLRSYCLDMSAAKSLDAGFLGFPLLRLQRGEPLRVFGLGESSKESIEGGGEGAFVLRHLISDEKHEGKAPDPEASRHWSVMSASLGLLLAGWLVYALVVTLI